jgi:hypothetical protein
VTIALSEPLPSPTAVPESLAPTELFARENENNRVELAARIAALLSRPIDYIDDAYCQIAPLQPAQVRAMAKHPSFRRPINRAVADSIGLAKFDVGKELMARLVSSPSSRLAAMICTSPMQEVQQIAFVMVAVVVSKRIRALVLKSEREIVREAIGNEGFTIGIHEAPVLYPALCELDGTPAEECSLSHESDEAARQVLIFEFAMQILGRFLEASEPVLAELFALRIPPTVNYAKRDQVIRPFDGIHREQFLKLVRRRQKSWAAIID